jgi:hypothetical protein
VLLALSIGLLLTLAGVVNMTSVRGENGKGPAPGVLVVEQGWPLPWLLRVDAPPGMEREADEARAWMLEWSEFEDQRMIGPIAEGWFFLDWMALSIAAGAVVQAFVLVKRLAARWSAA